MPQIPWPDVHPPALRVPSSDENAAAEERRCRHGRAVLGEPAVGVPGPEAATEQAEDERAADDPEDEERARPQSLLLSHEPVADLSEPARDAQPAVDRPEQPDHEQPEQEAADGPWRTIRERVDHPWSVARRLSC